MNLATDGLATLHTRVESWECDFNGHWNTRYYARAFQAAAIVGASLGGAETPVDEAHVRHCRFHGELAAGDAVTVRSFRLEGEERATVHVLTKDGVIAATAVDHGGRGAAHLPLLSEAEAALALPRGLSPTQGGPDLDPAATPIAELGPALPEELDASGAPRFDACVARLASASHHHMTGLGFTHDFTRRTGIGRMLVELRFTRLGSFRAGQCLRAASLLVSTREKSFVTRHVLSTHAGDAVATFELCTLAVDLRTRRAVQAPDFIRALRGDPEAGP